MVTKIQKIFYNSETIASLNYKTPNAFHTPLPFYATQIINPFFNSMISANHVKVESLSAYDENLIKGIIYLL